jgi:hypothetical protein
MIDEQTMAGSDLASSTIDPKQAWQAAHVHREFLFF